MFERMLVGKIENRILVGVLSFVGIMILLGWAAINEGGRMQAFTAQQQARSIENGAVLFSNNCSTCHGTDGRGLAGKAPGLNNPQFFGHDFFPEVTKQIADLQSEQANITKEKALETTSAERKQAIDARITAINDEITKLNADRASKVQAAAQKGYDPALYDRLKELGWSGTRPSFVLTTLIQGRPVSSHYWPQAMPAWSQTAGGPLRMDELQDITNYVLNWDKGADWTLDDLYAVNQFAIQPVDPGPLEAQIEQLKASGGKVQEPVGTDVQKIMADLANVQGDASRGDQLYHGTVKSFSGITLPCGGCHMPQGTGTGPQTQGTWSRVQNERLKQPQFQGYTPEQYLVESITHPDAYIVPNFQNVMPNVFGQQLSIQDLADIVAYLKSSG
jgi:mono/diheme cytochrome c family protein